MVVIRQQQSGGVTGVYYGSLRQFTITVNSNVDLSAATIQVALIKEGSTSTASVQWLSVGTRTATGLTLKVGPGGDVNPTPGTYSVRLKITDSYEVPWVDAGTIIVE